MPKLPRVTSKKLVAALLRAGFVIQRQRGSHIQLKHADGRRTVIARHAGDIPLGTLNGILSDLRIGVEGLKKLL